MELQMHIPVLPPKRIRCQMSVGIGFLLGGVANRLCHGDWSLIWVSIGAVVMFWAMFRTHRWRKQEILAKSVEDSLDLSKEGGITSTVEALGSGVGIYCQGTPGYAAGAFDSGLTLYQRLWRLVANPFTYLFQGKIRW